MDEQGYIALTDFGQLKFDSSEEESNLEFFGTPEYLAPEVLEGHGFSKASDWWTLGILIYEMLVGIPPFHHEDLDLMFAFIRKAEVKFSRSFKMSSNVKDLIR